MYVLQSLDLPSFGRFSSLAVTLEKTNDLYNYSYSNSLILYVSYGRPKFKLKMVEMEFIIFTFFCLFFVWCGINSLAIINILERIDQDE